MENHTIERLIDDIIKLEKMEREQRSEDTLRNLCSLMELAYLIENEEVRKLYADKIQELYGGKEKEIRDLHIFEKLEARRTRENKMR